jgi:hypothetical protein
VKFNLPNHERKEGTAVLFVFQTFMAGASAAETGAIGTLIVLLVVVLGEGQRLLCSVTLSFAPSSPSAVAKLVLLVISIMYDDYLLD